MRPGDIVGRYGGDEFIIMITGITLPRADQAMYAAKRAGGGTWRIDEDTTKATRAALPDGVTAIS